ncbi:hypothetical protein E4U21_001006 [Claviceps maximensis]|nr:hypothetical protein E4U21_001006 [Claviceps maximensis]
MDPISVGGLALGVASLSLQVLTGCIQGIQLLITALGYQDECRYLNLRLRMEQQRLFIWSETSGLLDLDDRKHDKILNSNIFSLHRQTVLDMLVQIRCLFDEFTSHQRRHANLKPIHDVDNLLSAPDMDAKQANFPMSEKKRDFIRNAMNGLRAKSKEGYQRLRWISFDKAAFELLLHKFSDLNDSMTSLLDHSLQVDIRNSVQDTNRGVLLLHHKIADLSHLVVALKFQLDTGRWSQTGCCRLSQRERDASADALMQLSKLATFKAFNQTLNLIADRPPSHEEQAAARFLELANPSAPRYLELPRHLIELDPAVNVLGTARCDAMMRTANGRKKVWIEWKDYDMAGAYPNALSKQDIVDRVRKLASLLNHSPKPEAFRTPHCLGFFDKADINIPVEDVDILDRRLGLVFERPNDDLMHISLPPVSLNDLLQDGGSVRKPRVTERVRLAYALSNCLLYLHTVNWLHKGLRSHNVLFYRRTDGQQVDYRQPYLSGFDFSRPSGSDEMTDVPGDDTEQDLYRHPDAQANRGDYRQRSKKSFDIYSLGVMFVELAHWKTIDKVLGIDVGRARGRPEMLRQVRDRLLQEGSMADIGAQMGEKYEEATVTCLAGGTGLGLQAEEDEAEDEVAEKLSTRFYQDVVKRLANIQV